MFLHLSLVLFVISAVLFIIPAHASKDCVDVFSLSSSKANESKGDRSVSKVKNKEDQTDKFTKRVQLGRKEALMSYMKQLLEWSEKEIQKMDRVRVKREETRHGTKSVFQKMEFFLFPQALLKWERKVRRL